MDKLNNILFTHSYFMRFDPKQWSLGLPYAPLGTLYAASVMRDNGYSVSLCDTMFATGPDISLPAIEQTQPGFFVIYDDGFNYLTKMCLTNMREAAFTMCKMAKARGCTVIVSSSDSTDRYTQYLNEGADFVIIGEAEQTLLELVNTIKSGDDHQHICGIAYLKDGIPYKTLGRPLTKNLDSIPLPAWDLVDIKPYRDSWLKNAGYFSVNMSTTRGCPFKCNWCAKPIYGNRYNTRSPENVISELKLLKQMFGMDHIWFCDDIFGLKPGWVLEFARLVEQENLYFEYKIQSRADLLLEENTVQALAASGCENVWIGAESGSQKILDAMDKGITISQVREATLLLKKYNIKVAYFLQFGYPGENMDDIDMTLDMLRKNMPDDIGISVSYPLPGTKFYDMVGEQLKQKANWTDSDDLALMFRNTFDTTFYRRLHKYVHVYFRKLKAISNPRFSVKKIISIPYYAIRESRYRYLINKSGNNGK